MCVVTRKFGSQASDVPGHYEESMKATIDLLVATILRELNSLDSANLSQQLRTQFGAGPLDVASEARSKLESFADDPCVSPPDRAYALAQLRGLPSF
jgi:hypothetical protein